MMKKNKEDEESNIIFSKINELKQIVLQPPLNSISKIELIKLILYEYHIKNKATTISKKQLNDLYFNKMKDLNVVQSARPVDQALKQVRRLGTGRSQKDLGPPFDRLERVFQSRFSFGIDGFPSHKNRFSFLLKPLRKRKGP